MKIETILLLVVVAVLLITLVVPKYQYSLKLSVVALLASAGSVIINLTQKEGIDLFGSVIGVMLVIVITLIVNRNKKIQNQKVKPLIQRSAYDMGH